VTEVGLIVAPRPFSAQRHVVTAPAGGTIAELVAHAPIDPALRALCQVWLVDPVRGDEALVLRANWHRVRPKPGMQLLLRVVPQRGRGGGGKNVLRTVLAIAVVVAATALGGPLAGALGFTAGTTAFAIASATISLGITVAGNLLLNALVPVGKPKISALSSPAGAAADAPSSPTLSITGSQNRANPYGAVPRVYGRHRVFPTLAAPPVSELVGDEQYLRLLFDFGYGPLALSDYRIGTTPLGEFEGVQIEGQPGWPTDPPIGLYPSQVAQDELAMRLLLNAPQVLETRDATDEITLDITWPNGLASYDAQGRRQDQQSSVSVDFAPAGTEFWVPGPRIDVIAATEAALRRGIRIVPGGRGRWRVRVTVVYEGGPPQSAVRKDVFLTALRSIRWEAPVRAAGRCLVALRIKATDQLNGTVDEFNAIAQAVLPVWTGTGFGFAQTRNPAWAYLDVLRGSANARPIADDRIDLPAFAAWAAECDQIMPDGQPRRAFDGVIDFRSTVFQVLQDIAAAGRATPAMRDGKFSIVRDVPQSVPIQHFTPRNSRGFKGTKAFPRRVDALRVRYIEPARDWSQQEVVVYADGQNAATARTIEPLEMFGVTHAAQAWREGRYHLAVARLRPETYSIETDIEHLVCTRGDLVRVSHDVALWGGGAARVRDGEAAEAVTFGGAPVTFGGGAVEYSSAAAAGLVRLDDLVVLRGGRPNVLRWRAADGTSRIHGIVDVAADTETDEVQLASPLPGVLPQPGELAMVGEAGRETVELLVKSITPGPDLSATLVLVDAAPAVHQAESGVIPPFDPQLSIPPTLLPTVPRAPVIESVDTGTAGLLRGQDGTVLARAAVTLRPADAETLAIGGWQLRSRVAGSGAPWSQVSAPGGGRTVLFSAPLEEGTDAELQARALTADGRASAWSAPTIVPVVGKTAPPADVTNFRISGRVLDWDPVPDADLAGYAIRWAPGRAFGWEAATPAHGGLLTSSPFTLDERPANTTTLLIKAVDSGGRESATPAAIVTDLGDPRIENAAALIDFRALSWAGSETGFTPVSGDLLADEAPGGPMWGDAALLLYPDEPSPMFPGVAYVAAEYIAEVDFADLPATSRVVLRRQIEGEPVAIDYRANPLMFPSGGAPMFPSDPAPMFAQAPTDWLPWPGELRGVGQFDLRVRVGAGEQRGRIVQLAAAVDAPAIIEPREDVAIAATDTRVPPLADFRFISAVTASLQGGTTARRIEVVNRDPDLGPLIRAFDAAGTRVATTLDLVLHGY